MPPAHFAFFVFGLMLLKTTVVMCHRQPRRPASITIENCSLGGAVGHLKGSPLFEAAAADITRAPRGTHGPGALVTAWAGGLAEKEAASAACLKATRDRYCEKHGYVCYFLFDTPQWKLEREKRKVSYWFVKLQALEFVLPRHDFVLSLDLDAAIYQPLAAMSVEHAALISGVSPKTSVWLPAVRNSPGGFWNADSWIAYNTPWTKAFIQHIWATADTLWDGVDDQTAYNLAMHDSLLVEKMNSVHLGKVADVVKVSTTETNHSCCNVNYAIHNWGRAKPGRPTHVYNCINRWAKGLELFKQPASTAHVHFFDYRSVLQIRHPTKNMVGNPNTTCAKDPGGEVFF